MSLLLRLRFLVYGAVIVLGAMHVLGPGEPSAASPHPPGRVLQGYTRYGGVWLTVVRGRPTMLGLSMDGECHSGRSLRGRAGFVDAFPGDWRRSGRSFADSWYTELPNPEGVVRRVSAHMDGVMGRDGTGASGRFTEVARFVRGGRVVDVCTASFHWHVRA
jgi:hypothetical protein